MQVGGLEIAALAGAYVRAAQRGMAVLVDGFISSSAALLAVQLNPACARGCSLPIKVPSLATKPCLRPWMPTLLHLEMHLGEDRVRLRPTPCCKRPWRCITAWQPLPRQEWPIKYENFWVDLIRHGEPEGGDVFRGHSDHPLTELGWQQFWERIDKHRRLDASHQLALVALSGGRARAGAAP